MLSKAELADPQGSASTREQVKSRTMTDPRSEDQKVAAVNASMVMAGQSLSAADEAVCRRILRGEISADEAVLEYLEENGFGNSSRAAELRRRIAGAAWSPESH